MPKSTLTKSLHTITAVANVAKFLHAKHRSDASYHGNDGAVCLATDSLEILGYTYSIKEFRAAMKTDPTIAKIYRACVNVMLPSTV